MFREWLIKHCAKWETHRAARRRNYRLLQYVANSLVNEYKFLPYSMLSDPRKFISGAEAIVNGVWISWRSEFKKSYNGTITIVIKLNSSLAEPCAAKLARSILKRPEDTGTPYKSLQWIEPIPTFQIDADAATLQLGFLDQIADAVIDEYESLPYASFVDLKKLSTSVEVIVNDIPIFWNFDYQPPREGNITVDFEFHTDFPTKWGAKPSRSFVKQPGDVGAPRENLRWVRLTPILQIDEVEITSSE